MSDLFSEHEKPPDIREYNDEGLCVSAEKGCKDAEEELLIRYIPLVRRLVRPYFLAGGDGDDLLQEGMIALLRAVHEYNPELGASFKTYAELCVRRRISSVLRNAMRGKHSPLNRYVSIEEGRAAEWARVSDPEEVYIAREEIDAYFFRLKGVLSRFEAEVLDRYLEGMTVTDISDSLSRSYKSVDNAVTRIRRKAAASASK